MLNPKWVRCGIAATLIAAAIGCQQRIAKQPAYRPLTQTTFYADERSSRPLEEGVVHRNQILDHDPLASGLSADGKKPQTVNILDEKGNVVEIKTGPGTANKVENFVTRIPFKATAEDINRGKERYTIYCAPCHGVLGDGYGKIVERGNLRPTHYHNDNSRGFAYYKMQIPMKEVPIGYIFEVITKGYGGMPNFTSEIPLADRWRIALYVKALQENQATTKKGGN